MPMQERGQPARIWDDIVTQRDRDVFERSGHGALSGFGARPALLVIDVTYNFTGGTPEPVLKSIERWPYSSGEAAWIAVECIARLLVPAREAGIPIIYTTDWGREDNLMGPGRYAAKNWRDQEYSAQKGLLGDEIVAEIRPRPEDVVLRKDKASAFFGTPLASYLIDRAVDTVIVCGGTTSGCVRATVVDAFSYNFKTIVIQEGTFDRGEASHKVSLFDMHQKYADIVDEQSALTYLAGLTKKRVTPAGTE